MDLDGFECVIRHRELYGSIALESDSWPQLLLIDATKENEAKIKIEEILSEDSKSDSLPEWTCFNCRETIEGQFTNCWKCSYPKR
jgi:hypothetical protein